MTFTEPPDAGGARRTDALMRETRSTLRRLERLSATAAGAEPAIRHLLDEAVAAVERAVEELARQQEEERQRLAEALRPGP